MSFHSMADMRREEEERKKGRTGGSGDDKKTDSYAGGGASGLAIENPSGSASNRDNLARLAADGAPPEGATVVTLWKNGFQVDGGEFRPISDAINKKFVDEIKDGIAPEELAPRGSSPLHIKLEDKRGQEYDIATKSGIGGSYNTAAPPAFTGEGMSLGGGANASAVAATGTAEVQVDESSPTTQIQFRFGDGKNKRQVFNETHTVRDLRTFVQQCLDGNANFQLVEGFPPKPINAADDLTLKEANLLKSAIIVKSQ